MIFEAIKTQEASPMEGLNEILESLLWNLMKAGDLSASAITDLLHGFGFSGIHANSLLKKLRSKIFLIEKGDSEALKE